MAVSRVTQSSISAIALRGLQGSLTRVQELQQQLSSGKRVSQPSDDPSATAAAMKLRAQRRGDEQYLRNIDDATGRLNVADDALTEISERVRRARDLVTSAGDGATSTEGLSAIGVELTNIRKDVIDLYNTRWLGRPVFGGTVQGGAAIDATGTYVGNDADVQTRISADSTINVAVKGTTAGADTLPALIGQIATDVVTDPTTVGANLDALDAQLQKVLTSLGDVGARESRLDTTKANVDSQRLDFTSRISENEDVDLPQAIMNLQSQQVAYQSALGAASKVLQVSLLDFLK